MSDEAPLLHVLEVDLAAVAAGSDAAVVVGECPEDGTISKVAYIPNAAVTGANTNTRTVAVVNKGGGGAGTTAVASLALVSGANLAAFDENAITLSGTAGHLTVAAGDVLEWTSTHASSGLADPGGKLRIEVTR